MFVEFRLWGKNVTLVSNRCSQIKVFSIECAEPVRGAVCRDLYRSEGSRFTMVHFIGVFALSGIKLPNKKWLAHIIYF